MIRLARLTLLVPPLLFLGLALFGCAGPGAPPPSATGIPWDPNLLTVSRQGEADRWAADVARRQYVDRYMAQICAPDGPWATMNAEWLKQQKSVWTDTLWKFQPIPNAPPTNSVDFGAIIGAVLGTATKLAPLFMDKAPHAAVIPGLPPC